MKAVLKAILVSGVVVTVVVLPGTSILLKYLIKDDPRDKRRFKKVLWDLEKGRYIKVFNDGGARVSLTNKGKQKALEYDYDQIEIKKPKQWDGWWRLVIFDIPEPKKRRCWALNAKLKEIGFISIQKSTFVYPYDAKKEIDQIRNFLAVKKHVDYLVVKSIENSADLKKHFRLL